MTATRRETTSRRAVRAKEKRENGGNRLFYHSLHCSLLYFPTPLLHIYTTVSTRFVVKSGMMATEHRLRQNPGVDVLTWYASGISFNPSKSCGAWPDLLAAGCLGRKEARPGLTCGTRNRNNCRSRQTRPHTKDDVCPALRKKP